jgi:hypothetical protein
MTPETPPQRSKSFLDRIRPHSRSPSPDGHSRTACSSDMFSMFKQLATASSTPPLTPRSSSEIEPSLPVTPETSSPSETTPSLTPKNSWDPCDNSVPPESTDDHPSSEEKIAAIQAEFGDIASVMEDDQGHTAPEVMLAESGGAMFK